VRYSALPFIITTDNKDASVSEMQKLREDFDLHVVEDSKWKAEQEQRWERCNAIQDQTIKIQQENAVQLKALAEDTAGVIAIYKDTKSVVRAGTALQKGMIWMLKWGAIGTGIVAIADYLIEFFNQPPIV
tara:strand:- start:234 stop:623 length:390 start_codon:yes stop_codon:yes gene_type:complete